MTDLRLIVTGSRSWPSENLVWESIAFAIAENIGDGGTVTVVHGACPTGADAFAHSWFGLPLDDPTITAVEEPHPADWNRYGKAAGPMRNQQMVDAGADLVLAFPLPGPRERSKGTWDCVDEARAADIPVEVQELDFQPRLTFGDVERAARLIGRAVSDG